MNLFRAQRKKRRPPSGSRRLHDLPPIERRAKLQAEDHPGGEVALEKLRSEMLLFKEMFDQFLSFRLRAASPEEIAPKKIWTPRSEAPLANLRQRRLFPVHLIRGRVHFACPACQRPTELAAEQAGGKARCQLCHSAIIVPRPGRAQRGLNMEQDVESVLHPERFQVMPVQGWAAVRQKHFRQARILASLSVLFILLLANGYHKLMGGRLEPFSASAGVVAAKVQVEDPFTSAEAVVRAYLAADGYRAKSAFVRDPERVAPLMQEYFARHAGAVPVTWKSVQAGGTGFYSGDDLSFPITKVGVETIRGDQLEFTVEQTPRGPLIEWETSLGYSPKAWPEVLAAKSKSPLRVLAALADYYNFDFNDERGQLCVRLQDPQNKELLGYGYLERNHPVALELRGMLEDASPESPRPIVVEVAATERSQATKQVRIVKVVSDGWRALQPTMASVP